jgi:hypothetical protein
MSSQRLKQILVGAVAVAMAQQFQIRVLNRTMRHQSQKCDEFMKRADKLIEKINEDLAVLNADYNCRR